MTDYIHFSENNLDVYSIKLANFILGANVECESLLKELFKLTEHYQSLSEDEQKESLENSTYVQVNAVYKLDMKTIFMTSKIFYFQDIYSEPFKPFKYKKNKKDSRQIYNAIKHDKVNHLEAADLETALNMLGTLFVLNSYFYPELINKDQDDRSKIFRGRTAYIEPLFLSGIDEIDKLDKKEVADYFESCSYYAWIQSPELKNPRDYALREINFMLENHRDETNRSLDDLLESRRESGKLYEGNEYPFLLAVPVISLNNGKNISMLLDEAKEFYGALEQMKVPK